MTKNKDEKRLIRERMSKTGESYTSAREHFLGTAAPSVPDDAEVLRPRVPDLSFDLEAWLESESRFYGIRVVHESSGRWVARSDDYPKLRGEGDDDGQARLDLIKAIQRSVRDDFDWRDAVDPETAFILENQDDD